MLINLVFFKRFIKLNLVRAGILWGLTGFMFSCAPTGYVKDGLAENAILQEGFISRNVYQFWYEDPWDNQSYYVKGLQEPKNHAKGVRFIDLIQGARAKIDERAIKKKINSIFSSLACGNDSYNVLPQLLSAALEYRVEKEEYYLNGAVYWLIRVRTEELEDLVENLSC